ncbi:hypothetical protein VNO78_08013 [Psophocarpus tetragonolobus]|uniref:Adenylosuccinate synthetase, chloroplastic n=1 Tax=Psophocarpus tetragonolobus TaxID=3891 RepID=A0AAN9XSY7_PSOTE
MGRLDLILLDAALRFKDFNYGPDVLKEEVEKYKRYGERLEPFIADTVHVMNDAIAQKKILELIPLLHHLVHQQVVKAYTTRVGSGPFPTEILGSIGDLLRFAGQEFGNITGRPRRCGWLDIVALKYSCQINGFSALNLTKLDILSNLDEIQLGVSYKLADGTPVKSFPSDLRLLEQLNVEYEVVPGWKSDISCVRNYSDLPKAARQYVERSYPLHWCWARP